MKITLKTMIKNYTVIRYNAKDSGRFNDGDNG
jgi:hypothetical protein